ncbi:MAG: winged helix-turn-helix transcriptional regulator [Clostridiales bacterium]|nr:winged helix-turn-helix transcriptional regulator [Clostridiales bacterium]
MKFIVNNIVLRIQYNEVPPRVEYSLTDLGKSLKPILILLSKWGTDVINSKMPK